MRKIYLATPYSDPDPEVQNRRFEQVNRVASLLMAKGYLVFSPISHTHPIALAGELPKEWGFWRDYDFTFIGDWADAVFVLRLDGWAESIGVQAEIKLAEEIGKPVAYLAPEDFGIENK